MAEQNAGDAGSDTPGWVKGCGVGCLVILVIAGVGGYFAYTKFIKPGMAFGQQMMAEMSQVNSTGEDAAKNAAGKTIAVDKLEADPSPYLGKWVSVKGTLSAGGAAAQSNMPGPAQGGRAYTLGNKTMVMLAQPGGGQAEAKIGEEAIVVGFVSSAFSDFFGKFAQGVGAQNPGTFPCVTVIAKTVKPAGGGTKPKQGAAEEKPK